MSSVQEMKQHGIVLLKELVMFARAAIASFNVIGCLLSGSQWVQIIYRYL